MEGKLLENEGEKKLCWLCCLPESPEDRMLLETVTLSSEFLAQSTIPLQPFMGKVMSVAAFAGSL